MSKVPTVVVACDFLISEEYATVWLHIRDV
jgi:hypothetical protein